MSDLLGEYSVIFDSCSIGKLKIYQEGLQTVFNCTCTYESAEILRLAVISDQEFIPIGVMLPRGETMTLKKNFSKNTLRSMGITKINSCHLIRAGESFAKKDILVKDQNEKQILPATATEQDSQTTVDHLVKETRPNNKHELWQLRKDPSALFSDPDLAENSMNIAGAMTRMEDNLTFLAVPVSPNKPFPMMPIFCFGNLEFIDGESYLIFKIRDKNLVQ